MLMQASLVPGYRSGADPLPVPLRSGRPGGGHRRGGRAPRALFPHVLGAVIRPGNGPGVGREDTTVLVRGSIGALPQQPVHDPCALAQRRKRDKIVVVLE
jgi:hypothetical protein